MREARERPSEAFRRLATLEKRALELLLAEGEPSATGALDGWEYRGMNVGTGPKLLGIQKFMKGFSRRADGALFGYNLRVKQDGPGAPWVALPEGSAPRRFGFYRVSPVDPSSPDGRYPNALLLDYGQGGNGRLSPLSTLRDYLVRAEPGSDDLLLGKAYIALGPVRVPVGYFVLERYRERVP